MIPYFRKYPDSNVHGANMGPTWVLSAPDGPNVFCHNDQSYLLLWALLKNESNTFHLSSTIIVYIGVLWKFSITWNGYMQPVQFSQQTWHWWAEKNTPVVANDSDISHDLNWSMNLPTIIVAIIQYTPNMIVPHKLTQIWCSALPN